MLLYIPRCSEWAVMTHKLGELYFERSVDKGVLSAKFVLLESRECLDWIVYVLQVYVVVVEVEAKCLYFFEVTIDFVGRSLAFVADLCIAFIYK